MGCPPRAMRYKGVDCTSFVGWWDKKKTLGCFEDSQYNTSENGLAFWHYGNGQMT